MRKYTKEKLIEEYDSSRYVITHFESTYNDIDLLHKILFLSDKVVELTNKNIELEERIEGLEK